MSQYTPYEEEQGRIAKEIFMEKGKLSCEEMPKQSERSEHTPPDREVCVHGKPINWHCSRCESGDKGISQILITGIGFLSVPTEHKEFIVRAVNSHELLLDALKTLVNTRYSDAEDFQVLLQKLVEARRKARLAIAQAEGKP